LAQW